MKKGTGKYYIKKCPVCETEFIVGSNNKKKKFCSKSCSKVGINNPMWAGDDVKYGGLHRWVESKLGRPDRCSRCGEIGAVDLANIGNNYTRDLNNWEWLCRKCHMTEDGRRDEFISHHPAKKVAVINCKNCNKSFEQSTPAAIYCSKSCAASYGNKIGVLGKKNKQHPRPCIYCGKIYKPYGDKSRYCSKSCRATDQNLNRRIYKKKAK